MSRESGGGLLFHQAGVRKDRDFKKLSPVTLGQSPSKQRALDTLVSSTIPSLAEQIHGISNSMVNSSHSSVSYTGDLDLVSSDFMDLVNVIKTRKHRSEAFYDASLGGQQG